MPLSAEQKRENRARDRRRDRFDLAPLLDLLSSDVAAAAESVGVTTPTMYRWRIAVTAVAEGREPRADVRLTLTRTMADQYACRIGVHPSYIWRDW